MASDCYVTLTKLSKTVFKFVENDQFGENPFIYAIIEESKAVLIDTGCGSGDLLSFVRQNICADSPILVINTHNHFDHVGANWLFADAEGHKKQNILDLCASSRDRAYTEDPFNTMGWYAGSKIKPYKITRWLEDGEKIYLSEKDNSNYLKVIHTPGHTPDSLCLWYPNDKRLFVGDFVYRFCPVLAVSVKSDAKLFENSAGNLCHFVTEKERETGAKIKLSCGHIDDNLDSAFLRKFTEFLKKVNSGKVVNRGGTIFAEYQSTDADFSFVQRRFMGCDKFVKPLVKLFVRS